MKEMNNMYPEVTEKERKFIVHNYLKFIKDQTSTENDLRRQIMNFFDKVQFTDEEIDSFEEAFSQSFRNEQ